MKQATIVRSFGLVMLVLAAIGASRCARGVRPDPQALAMEAGDYTALIAGCGRQWQVQDGYLYCRVAEGPVGDLALRFVAPPVSCKEDSCVSFTIFDPTGVRPPYSDSIPRGQTEKAVPWKILIGADNFTAGDRGFWPYVYEINWIDTDGNPRKTVSEGEIRLRVYRSKVCSPSGVCRLYQPLSGAAEDPNFVWRWSAQSGIKSQLIKMTTSARTRVDDVVTEND